MGARQRWWLLNDQVTLASAVPPTLLPFVVALVPRNGEELF